MSETFKMSLDRLPPSINNYLKTTIETKGGHTYPKQYESKESVDFKKYLRNKLRKEMIDQNWDKTITSNKNEHWYIELRFRNSKAGQDTSNYYKVLLDALTGHLYMDDSNVQARTHRAWIDKDNPGFDFVFRRVPYVGLFDNQEAREKFVNDNCLSCRFYREGKCKVLSDITDGRANINFKMKNNTCDKYTEKKGS